MAELTGKTLIITGASMGIGRPGPWSGFSGTGPGVFTEKLRTDELIGYVKVASPRL